MAWNVESSKSSFNASEYVTKTISERDSSRSTKQSISGSRSSYSIVGINAAQVPHMREAIKNYVESIQNHLNGFNAAAESNMAFKSSLVKTSVETYMVTLKEYCQNLTSQLIAFSDKLSEVYRTWVSATQDMAGTINMSSSSFNKGTKYTEQK